MILVTNSGMSTSSSFTSNSNSSSLSFLELDPACKFKAKELFLRIYLQVAKRGFSSINPIEIYKIYKFIKYKIKYQNIIYQVFVHKKITDSLNNFDSVFSN